MNYIKHLLHVYFDGLDVTCTGCETLGECLPIPTPDEAFRDPNRCIPFKRSQIFLKDGCPPGMSPLRGYAIIM